MIFARLAFLADENIHPAVIAFLRSEGSDVLSVRECGLSGRDDESILAHAVSEQRTVPTHDADFGKLAIAERKPFHGIVFLRPGHIRPEYTIASLQTLLGSDAWLLPPFLLVAVRKANQLRVRMRSLSNLPPH